MAFRPKNYRHKETALKGDPPSSGQQYYTFSAARRIPDHNVGAGPRPCPQGIRPYVSAPHGRRCLSKNYVTIGRRVGAFRYVDRQEPVSYNHGDR